MISNEKRKCLSQSILFRLVQINKYAFSGGKDSVEEHRKLGGDTEVDIAYQYLTFFLEDEEKLKQIKEVDSYGLFIWGNCRIFETILIALTNQACELKCCELAFTPPFSGNEVGTAFSKSEIMRPTPLFHFV